VIAQRLVLRCDLRLELLGGGEEDGEERGYCLCCWESGCGEDGVCGELFDDGCARELRGQEPEADEAAAGAVAGKVEVVLVEADSTTLLELA
jgi:hypothetical protein